MIWYSGKTALFPFLLAKAALAFLPTALSVALRPLFPFWQAQYVPVFPLKPAPFCMLFAGLGSTNKPATSLLFFFYVTLALSLSPGPLLHFSFLSQTLWKILQELSPLSSCSIRLQWVPRHSFIPRNDTADGLARWGALLVPSAISSSLSPLISRNYSSLFSDWRHTVSPKFFDTQVPSISTEELVLPCHARCVLSRLRCNGYSLVKGFYRSRIGRILPAAPLDTHPRTPLISFCTVQLRTLCTAHSLATLCPSTTSGPDLGELPGFWGSMVFCHATSTPTILWSHSKTTKILQLTFVHSLCKTYS